MLNGDKQKRALGRGLSALIPQAAPAGATVVAAPEPAPAAKPGVLKLPIERIQRDPRQPRRHFDEEKLRELTESIRTQGLLQPVLVRKDGRRLAAHRRRAAVARRPGSPGCTSCPSS